MTKASDYIASMLEDAIRQEPPIIALIMSLK